MHDAHVPFDRRPESAACRPSLIGGCPRLIGVPVAGFGHDRRRRRATWCTSVGSDREVTPVPTADGRLPVDAASSRDVQPRRSRRAQHRHQGRPRRPRPVEQRRQPGQHRGVLARATSRLVAHDARPEAIPDDLGRRAGRRWPPTTPTTVPPRPTTVPEDHGPADGASTRRCRRTATTPPSRVAGQEPERRVRDARPPVAVASTIPEVAPTRRPRRPAGHGRQRTEAGGPPGDGRTRSPAPAAAAGQTGSGTIGLLAERCRSPWSSASASAPARQRSTGVAGSQAGD